MNHDPEREFNQNLAQLMKLLKKIVRDLPHASPLSNPAGCEKDHDLQVNFFFIGLPPVSDEEFDEWAELYERFLCEENPHQTLAAPWSRELNPDDLEFLRRHGIRF